ncbi:MAG TPA: alpha/beta fold hydrolase [Pseudonocardiaceae bacterium]|nr:alpha/beta fold hydrolase [Pseudonocardiaceae bacterium]
MLRVVLVLIAVVFAVLVLAWTFQRHLIYLPDSAAVPPAAELLLGARDVTLRTEDGLSLGAYLVPPSGPNRGMTVLVAPGNAGSRVLRVPLAQRLAARGFGVLLMDYRGYGGNPGNPSEHGLIADVRAAYQYLVQQAGAASPRLVYFGESLGAAVVTRLAVEHPPAALVLRSPFTDLASVGTVHYPLLPVRQLLWDRFPVTELIARVRVPTVIVYGGQDTIVPPEQSRAVAAAAGGPVRTVEVAGADHNDPALLTGDELIDAITAML